jgi:hypothetical protein
LLGEIAGDHPAEISAPWRLVLAGMPSGGGDGVGVQRGFAGCRALPGSGMGWWEVGHRRSASLTGVDFPAIGTTS